MKQPSLIINNLLQKIVHKLDLQFERQMGIFIYLKMMIAVPLVQFHYKLYPQMLAMNQ